MVVVLFVWVIDARLLQRAVSPERTETTLGFVANVRTTETTKHILRAGHSLSALHGMPH